MVTIVISPQNYTVSEGTSAEIILMLNRSSQSNINAVVTTMDLSATGDLYCTLKPAHHYLLHLSSCMTFKTYEISSNHLGDVDYTTGSFRAFIPSGNLKVTVSIPTLRDNLAEDSEHFKANLSLAVAPGNVIIGSPYVAYVTITDVKRMYLICMSDNSMTFKCVFLCAMLS